MTVERVIRVSSAQERVGLSIQAVVVVGGARADRAS
jgi:hypothetical protein